MQRHGLYADDGWRDELATVLGKDLTQLVRDVREWVESSSYESMPPATFDAIHKSQNPEVKGIQILLDNMMQMCHLANMASRGGNAASIAAA